MDPARAYPLDFVVYRITGYQPKSTGDGGTGDGGTADLLTGLALQHDLGLLIEQVSDTLDLHVVAAADRAGADDRRRDRPLRRDQSKTIQRWRRRGLPARRFAFADGKRRVGFLLSSVERFIAGGGGGVVTTRRGPRTAGVHRP